MFWSLFAVCLYMHKISLVEPLWWDELLQKWQSIQAEYWRISDLAPIFADVFVLIYPIFLVCVYIIAIVKRKKMQKQWALFVFFSTFFSVFINIWIQSFFSKERPIVALSHIETEETLLHNILPSSSFPSDHAVVSMSFAIAVLVRWIYSKKKFFIWSGIVLIFVALLMTSCRILTLVHRPTDILAWLCLWIIVPCILMFRPIRNFIIRCFINPIIKIEEWIIKKIFKFE